jgi:hypothetical protein
MHDMHTNTMHHAWCQRMPQGNTQRTNAQTHKNTQKQKKCYKNTQKHAKRETAMAFKKTMATNETNTKGVPTQ